MKQCEGDLKLNEKTIFIGFIVAVILSCLIMGGAYIFHYRNTTEQIRVIQQQQSANYNELELRSGRLESGVKELQGNEQSISSILQEIRKQEID